MPFDVSTSLAVTINGTIYSQTSTITSNSQELANPSVAVAKIGTLTTRTDDDTGTFTMDSGHGWVTSDKVDVFWSGGSRRNMTATMTGDSAALDGGNGDVLPAATTAITAMKPTNVPFSVVGNDVDTLAVSLGNLTSQGWVVFKDGASAVLASYQIRVGERSKTWASGLGITNPLAGVTVASVDFSHDTTSAALTPIAAVTF